MDRKATARETLRILEQGYYLYGDQRISIEEAHEKLKAADEALVLAHKSQTVMLTQEDQGEKIDLSLLMVHAQDHLMTSLTFIDLAKEVVAVYERLNQMVK